ncbi:hypothetical protein CLCR_09709 [Cladophialophora carrionii]|uniref:DHHA2 domain-containing protein n=1 Tax=Cladophialophora carrionii TaxID=86049 RepID=A0A1C1CVQ2_9EURO|nr:hypothetical protein CLCR_09709 [Cladophialophora carrionii]
MSQHHPAESGPDEDNSMPLLRTYLSRIRSRVLSADTSSAGVVHGKSKSVLVMGNPSADLDSFISAVTTSYFYNLKSNSKHAQGRTYIPILNLPSVKAAELWRLRPEFGVAIRLALGESADSIDQGKAGEQGKTSVLEDLITIADVKSNPNSLFHRLFRESSDTESESESAKDVEKQDLFLVDHNAPAIPGLADKLISSRFTVTGCIDHHVDEDQVPQNATPRIVTTGIGSCASLVVKHLRDEALWPSEPPSSQIPAGLQEISRLALAPILIDTANLKATGDKCSDTDREAVKFLESVITRAPAQGMQAASTHTNVHTPTHTLTPTQEWHRDAFHSAIATAKSNSLDLLSMQEIFDRDYKVWTEPTSSGRDLNIGISSLVRPLSWLAKHAGGVDEFLAEIEAFAGHPERELGVFCMLTRTGDGRKEVVVLAFDEAVKGLVERFERQSQSGELQLQSWEGDNTLKEALGQKFGHKGEYRIWFMGDTSKSRKQVGPLLREAPFDLLGQAVFYNILGLALGRRNPTLALPKLLHLIVQPAVRFGVLLRFAPTYTLHLVASHPGSLTCLRGHLGLVRPAKCINICREGPALDARPDGGEECVDDAEIVDLEERPREHLVGLEEVMDVGAVVPRASVAGTVLAQGGKIRGMARGPQVDAQGRVRTGVHVVVRPCRDARKGK